jgi:3-hydroxyacyl-CoA dehydrogenase/3-hydroxy-2-methylbutyryl-CoA dehydrogenase
MQIAGSVAVITGGASGIGAANVRLLAEAGANVAILDVNAEAGAQLAATYGDRGVFVHTDVTKAEDAEAALLQVDQRFGALHITIN